MNKNVFVGKWKQVRGQIKVSYAKFTHHNWDQVAGKYDQFVGLVQEKYGVIRARKKSSEPAGPQPLEGTMNLGNAVIVGALVAVHSAI